VLKKSAIFVLIITLGFLACSDKDSGVGEVDGVYPAAINDLRVSDTMATALKLRWTAPGDDSLVGTASAYDIRIASSADYLIYFWNDAVGVPNVPRPSPAGQPESLLVEGLSFYFKYYFAIRSLDEAGNVSYISNIASGRPFFDSTVVINDDSLDIVLREHIWDYLPIDSVLDSIITYSKLLGLDTLNGKNRHISNIEQLYYAAELTRLNLANNLIDNIDVMSHLRRLDTLYLSYNRITDIDSLGALTNLQYLYLDSNLIDSIDALADLVNLAYINLDSNLIESIYPLVKNTGLGSGDYVSIRGNPFTDSTYIDSLADRGVIVVY